jgi:hypothetical protein
MLGCVDEDELVDENENILSDFIVVNAFKWKEALLSLNKLLL